MERYGISSVEKQCQNSISFTSALSQPSISRLNIKNMSEWRIFVHQLDQEFDIDQSF